jgi:hypothetical protein
VGHESVFPGDPTRQTEETMRNIEAVLDAAEVPGRGGRWARVYALCASTCVSSPRRCDSQGDPYPRRNGRPDGVAAGRNLPEELSSRSKRRPHRARGRNPRMRGCAKPPLRVTFPAS